MFLSVQELELRKVQFDVEFPPGEIQWDLNQLQQVANLKALGAAELLNNTLGEIRIRGNISVEMELLCDRCLDPVRTVVDEAFDLYYRPVPGKHETSHDLAIDDEEAQIGFYEGNGLQLEEALREHVLLALPMHQICREECAGLCPQCGRSRNTDPCQCEDRKLDDRWAALRKFRPGSETEGRISPQTK